MDDPSLPIVLALDSAGSACSVAVGDGAHVLAAVRRDMRHGHGEALMPMVDAAMREAGLAAADLDAVAVSLGPGGFTGIRIGLAAAHGIALGSGARLVGITSFAAVAATVNTAAVNTGRAVLVALDSRRADLYVQLFGAGGEPLGEPEAILPDRLAEWVAARMAPAPLLLAGDAAEAAAAALSGRPDIMVAPLSAPDARGVLAAAGNVLARDTTGDTTNNDATNNSGRPLYLRPPDVSFPAETRARLPRRQPVRRIAPLPLTAAGPLAILHRACFADDPWDAEALARILRLSGCFGHLAWERETPTGFVLARDLGDECEILSLGVAPEWRGRGTGARLMKIVLVEARRRGAASVVLEVAADNQPARRVYDGLGFTQVGRRPRYYRRADGMADALILRLSLANSFTSV